MLIIDTAQIKKTGEDLVKLSEELGAVIDDLYSRIYNMNKTTHEWVGNSADVFVKQANLVDKKDALSFRDTFRSFGIKLVDSANKYEKTIKQ